MSPSVQNSGGGRRPREVTGRTVLFCVVAFFGVVASVNAVMIKAAISTFGGLETESSYKAGLVFGREIAASQAQERRHWDVTARVGAIIDGQLRIEITALDASGRALAGYEALAWFSHPTDRRQDHTVVMHEGSAGRFVGKAPVAPGQWDLIIDLVRGEERVFHSRERILLKDEAAR